MKRTIWRDKSVRHNCQRAGLGVQAIHLVRQTRLRAEVLPVPILGVCEVDVAVAGVHRDIVQGIELPAEVIVGENCGQVSSELQFESLLGER